MSVAPTTHAAQCSELIKSFAFVLHLSRSQCCEINAEFSVPQLHRVYSFLDYIMGGCQIHFTVSPAPNANTYLVLNNEESIFILLMRAHFCPSADETLTIAPRQIGSVFPECESESLLENVLLDRNNGMNEFKALSEEHNRNS